MVVGEDKTKYIALILLLFVFSVFCFQNISAQVEPPGPEDAKSFGNDMLDTTKSALERVKKVGDRVSFFAPFFQHPAQKISSWWALRAQPWFYTQWNYLTTYLEQEIKIE